VTNFIRGVVVAVTTDHRLAQGTGQRRRIADGQPIGSAARLKTVAHATERHMPGDIVDPARKGPAQAEADLAPPWRVADLGQQRAAASTHVRCRFVGDLQHRHSPRDMKSLTGRYLIETDRMLFVRRLGV
jgi:hypothetical protein